MGDMKNMGLCASLRYYAQLLGRPFRIVNYTRTRLVFLYCLYFLSCLFSSVSLTCLEGEDTRWCVLLIFDCQTWIRKWKEEKEKKKKRRKKKKSNFGNSTACDQLICKVNSNFTTLARKKERKIERENKRYWWINYLCVNKGRCVWIE